MNCYNCPSYPLKPIKLEHDLPARECHRCGGLHIDLLSYRSWRDSRDHNNTNQPAPSVEPSDNGKALVCRQCSKLMLKYKISTDHDNYVDLCTTCDDAWLDGGEWQLLKHLDIQDKLTHIMTEPWQRKLQEKEFEKFQQEKLLEVFGAKDLERVREFAEWVAQHEKRTDILNYLYQKSEN